MIKFFRNLPRRQAGIRQNLLSEGKTGKPAWPAGRYLKYAMGEIFLFVIGILIALQINNWKEENKQHEITISYLKNLQSDFKQNEASLKNIFESLEGNKKAIKSIATFIDQGFLAYNGKNRFLKPFTEEFVLENLTENRNRLIPIIDTLSLVYNLNRAGFLINYDLLLPAWNDIINYGNLSLIKNTELKKEINNMILLVTENHEIEANLVIPVIAEYQLKRAGYYDTSKFGDFLFDEGFTKGSGFINTDIIITDKEFVRLLQRLYRASNEQRDNIRRLADVSNGKIIDLLNKELDENTR